MSSVFSLICFAFRVYTSLEDIKGNTTEPVKFTTSACEPDPPTPPKLANKNKTSITLKWNVSSCKLALEKYNCYSVWATLILEEFFLIVTEIFLQSTSCLKFYTLLTSLLLKQK